MKIISFSISVGILAAALAVTISWSQARAQTDSNLSTKLLESPDSVQVAEIMKRAMARDYSVVDGYDSERNPVKGVTRIAWVPPTTQDYEDIGKLGEKAIPALASYFIFDETPNGFEQLLAVKFLESIGTPSTVDPLGAVLNPKDWQVARLNALEVLGRMSDPKAALLISSVLKDDDRQVSSRAEQILALRETKSQPYTR